MMITSIEVNRSAHMPGAVLPRWLNFVFGIKYLCGSSVWNILHFTLLVHRVLTWLLDRSEQEQSLAEFFSFRNL